MMKSFVKETKMENKTYIKEENFNTNPYLHFTQEPCLRKSSIKYISGQRAAIFIWTELFLSVLIMAFGE